jgi:hypothetical protein
MKGGLSSLSPTAHWDDGTRPRRGPCERDFVGPKNPHRIREKYEIYLSDDLAVERIARQCIHLSRAIEKIDESGRGRAFQTNSLRRTSSKNSLPTARLFSRIRLQSTGEVGTARAMRIRPGRGAGRGVSEASGSPPRSENGNTTFSSQPEHCFGFSLRPHRWGRRPRCGDGPKPDDLLGVRVNSDRPGRHPADPLPARARICLGAKSAGAMDRPGSVHARSLRNAAEPVCSVAFGKSVR